MCFKTILLGHQGKEKKKKCVLQHIAEKKLELAASFQESHTAR